MKSKKTKNMLLTIMGVLIALEIVVNVIILSVDTFTDIVHLITLVFTALYGFWLYKKPHGNMLKYVMLVLAVAGIITGAIYLSAGRTYQIAKIIASAAMCYCAGRLNRIEQNKYIMPIIGVLFLGVSICAANRMISQNSNIWVTISCFTFTTNYIAIMISYFARYEEHKKIGRTK